MTHRRKACHLCGRGDRVRLTAASGRTTWRACRHCVYRATVLTRRAHGPGDLRRKAQVAHADGYEVWTSDEHVVLLSPHEAARLRVGRRIEAPAASV